MGPYLRAVLLAVGFLCADSAAQGSRRGAARELLPPAAVRRGGLPTGEVRVVSMDAGWSSSGSGSSSSSSSSSSFRRQLGDSPVSFPASRSASLQSPMPSQLPPLSSSATAKPHAWHVLISTEIYGETLATFSKRKQIEFLEALSQTVQLRWEWGNARGGYDESQGDKKTGMQEPMPRSLGTVTMHGVVLVPGAAIRAMLHLHSDTLEDVHAAVAKLESADFAHALAEQFAQMQCVWHTLLLRAAGLRLLSTTARYMRRCLLRLAHLQTAMLGVVRCLS